jgi:hypothetical protein
LTNYSNLKKKFYLSIDSPSYREEGVDEIRFFTLDGEKVILELKSNETKAFGLSLDKYNIIGGRKFQNGAGNGGIAEIILTDDKGNKIRLERDSFWGIVLGR